MVTRTSTLENFCIGACAVLPLLLASPASAQVWRSAGLTGGDVRALAVDPREPKIIYLGTTDGHIFGSRDAGESWKLVGLAGANSNAVVTALLVDPRNSSMIYAATWTREAAGESGGVFISGDGGVTWRESGLGEHAVRAMAQADSDPDTIVAGALDGIFVSHDGARSWQRVTPAGDDELRNFDSLAIDPIHPDIIYAGTFHLPWKTVDGGKHWSPIHSGMIDDSDVLSLAIDTTDPQRIFASACSGIYRSDAAGVAWEKIAGIPYSSQRTLVIRQDPSQPKVLYAGTTQGLWKSSDGGASWRRLSPGDWVINAIALDPASDSSGPESKPAHASRLLLGTEQQGVIASDDAGANFHAANDGFYHRRILSVAVDAQEPRHVAATLANTPESVVVSEDGGTTWAATVKGLGPDGVRAIFSFPNGWWAALPSGGLVHYDDAQQTWLRAGTFRANPAGSNAIYSDDLKGRVVRPVVNDLYVSETNWFAATEQGLFASLDQGKTWNALRFAPADLPVQSVRASKDGVAIRIVSSNGMVFSDDAGRSWTWHDLPLDSGGALKLEWVNGSTLLAAARTGLYISRDAGATWAKEGAGLPGARPQELLLRPGLWLVSMQSSGESGGLYASRDAGMSWSRIRSSDADQNYRFGDGEYPVLAAAGRSERILAGSASEGLYLLEFDRVLNAGAGQVTEAHVAGGGGH
jgi:photosystem II stability/assembly factor-like uncharacterized protein